MKFKINKCIAEVIKTSNEFGLCKITNSEGENLGNFVINLQKVKSNDIISQTAG